MPRTAFRLLVTVALLLAPSIALAHPGHGGDTSLLAGFLHPFGGLDHLLAMTVVGLFAAHLGGRALWAIPGRHACQKHVVWRRQRTRDATNTIG